MAEENDLSVQRALGRIEGGQQQLLDEVRALRTEFNSHVDSDQQAFSRLEADRNRAKGAGWVILTVIASMASVIGGAVMAVFEGWIKFG